MTKSDQKRSGRPVVIPLYGPLTWRNTISWLVLIACVLVIRWIWFEPYTIPSGSMEPTLHGDPRILRGDRVFIDKVRFGLRVPFMDARFIKGKSPERWDIVVFHSPDPKALHPILIKRVVGLPGERIHVGEDGKIYVAKSPQDKLEAVEPPADLKDVLHYVQRIGPNDTRMRQWILASIPYLVPEGPKVIASDNPAEAIACLDRLKKIHAKLGSRNPMSLTEAEITDLTKDLTKNDLRALTSNPAYKLFSDDHSRMVHADTPFRYGILDDDQYSLIPDGHYLMLGDNSNNSIDGRYFGWVPEDNIYGRAFCIWWPIPRMSDFTGFSSKWYGLFFLYVLPVLAVIWMITHRFILRTCKIHEPAIGGTFNVGERLVIDCLAYGLRTPFFRPRSFMSPPQKNDIVLCRAPQSEDDVEPRIVLGCVVAVPGENDGRGAKKLAERTYRIACDDGESGRGGWSQFVVEHDSLIGKVVSVCWPIAKRRKVKEFDPAITDAVTPK
jgi:signal peptidase I